MNDPGIYTWYILSFSHLQCSMDRVNAMQSLLPPSSIFLVCFLSLNCPNCPPHGAYTLKHSLLLLLERQQLFSSELWGREGAGRGRQGIMTKFGIKYFIHFIEFRKCVYSVWNSNLLNHMCSMVIWICTALILYVRNRNIIMLQTRTKIHLWLARE